VSPLRRARTRSRTPQHLCVSLLLPSSVASSTNSLFSPLEIWRRCVTPSLSSSRTSPRPRRTSSGVRRGTSSSASRSRNRSPRGSASSAMMSRPTRSGTSGTTPHSAPTRATAGLSSMVSLPARVRSRW